MAKPNYKKDDRIEATFVRKDDGAVFRHRGTVTYAGKRQVWFFLDNIPTKSAYVWHEAAPTLRKLNLLELLAEAAQ